MGPKTKNRQQKLMLSVLIPAYNEESSIRELLAKVLKALKAVEDSYKIRTEVIVVDDGSKDNTYKIVKGIAQEDPRIKVYTKPNGGKMSAIKYGFNKSNGDIVIFQDADLEYNPQDYVALLDPILKGKTKVVFGNRFGKDNKWLFHSKIANRFLSWFTNRLTGLGVQDMETCYKVLTRDVAEQIIPRLEAPRFGLEPEITMRLWMLGENVQNVPIDYFPRSVLEGKKINVNDFWEAIWALLSFRFFKKYINMPIPATFITYSVIGALALVVDFVSFWVAMKYLGLSIKLAQAVAYFGGTLWSFSLNRYINFKVLDKPLQRYLKFLVWTLIGAAWSSWLLAFLVNYLGIRPLVVKVLILPLVLIYQYTGSARWIFKKD